MSSAGGTSSMMYPLRQNKVISAVKSGIGLASSFNLNTNAAHSSGYQKFITSRTARVLLAGAGFLADAYDLFVINLVLRLLKDEYSNYATSSELRLLEGGVASAALFGSIFGQIVAGSLADLIGRKKIFVATAALITIGSIGSACTVDSEVFSIYGQIACWRFFLGAGVGGEYPLAATVTSESTSASRRGTLMAGVFSMQGVGSLISVVVVLTCLCSGFSTEFTWRFALAFGAAPAILAFPWRLLMHETETFQKLKENRHLHNGKLEETSHWEEIQHAFRLYKWHMFGTALCWFLLDVDFYANGLFSHEVTAKILSHDTGERTTAFEDTINAAILCLISVPGYYLSVLYMETVGRKNVQRNGFLAMSVLFALCGFAHDWFLDGGEGSLKRYLFLLVYALTFLFSNFGPNTTTFVIPGEIYPPEVRATCHGISAASGKLGAAAGAYFFPLVLGTSENSNPTPNGLKFCFYICSIVAVLGAIVTTLFIPTYGAVELEREDKYIALDYEYFHPPMSIMGGLQQHKGGYQMIEVIESACDYSLDECEEDNTTGTSSSSSAGPLRSGGAEDDPKKGASSQQGALPIYNPTLAEETT